MSRTTRILAVASGGGHWIQLLRLRRAFDGCDVHYATVDAADRAAEVDPAPCHALPDANRDGKLAMLRLGLATVRLALRVRPDVIVTTGAAPGLLSLMAGKLVGARTLFIDSMANGDELSMSGRLAVGRADAVFTQWEHLARVDGPHYHGAVL